MSLETLSPADYAAMNNGGGLFGGDNGIFIIILFLFLFGWGGNGYGRNGSAGAVDNYVLASDFSQVERKIDGVNNGLCSGFYEQSRLAANTDLQMAQGFAGAELSRAQQQAAVMAQLNANAMAVSNGFAETGYNIATQSCATQRAIESSTRDIIANATDNTRSILDALNAQRIEAKDAKIAEQAQAISALQLAASQAAQNNYIIGALRPSPIPAYTVANPYSYSGCGCGCG